MKTQDTDSTEQFKEQLKQNHYTIVLIDHLIKKIQKAQITTFQEINDLFMKETNILVSYFADNPSEISLIENKNPLCLSAIRDYLLKLFRRVHKNFCENVDQFVEALKQALVSQKKIIDNSVHQVVNQAATFLKSQNYQKILVYNFSKSVSKALKSLQKKIGNNLMVYICHGSLNGEGLDMLNSVYLEIPNCFLVEDVEMTYFMPEIDCVLTGAEVILEDGSIINRAGTYLAALCAREHRKPVIVLTECYKFVKKTYLSQKDIPNHMRLGIQPLIQAEKKIILIDLVPSKMIKLFCTDVGLITPENLATKMLDLFQ